MNGSILIFFCFVAVIWAQNQECPPNETLDKCVNALCQNQRCSQVGRPVACAQVYKCIPGCICANGYLRAANGTCVPVKDCEAPFDCSAKPNEQYDSCPPLCPTDACSLPRVKGQCPFNIGIVLECNPKCQCKDGYGRSDGTCVPFKDCPDLCPENEEYNSCTQAVCRQQHCANKDDPVACAAVSEGSCIKGCVCKENYYRNSNGTCVTSDQCTGSKCPNPHEVYSESTRIPNCPDLGTCNSIVARIRCDEEETSGCICEGGYLRLNRTSPCIPTCECPEMANSSECQK